MIRKIVLATVVVVLLCLLGSYGLVSCNDDVDKAAFVASASPTVTPTPSTEASPTSSKAPETTETPKPKATNKPVTHSTQPSATPKVTPTPVPNPCDIDLIKGTMSQEEAQAFVAKCPVAGKQAAQWLVSRFAANPAVYAANPTVEADLRELQRELGPANYGHMRAGLDLFQYLYANRVELGEKLAIAAANDKELAIDKQFLTLWVQASAWNAYPADVKMPWFNALAVRHLLARRA